MKIYMEKKEDKFARGRYLINAKEISKEDLEYMRTHDGMAFWWNGRNTDEYNVNLSLPSGNGWRITASGRAYLKEKGYAEEVI